jgi:hypothetical protein
MVKSRDSAWIVVYPDFTSQQINFVAEDAPKNLPLKTPQN